MKTNQTQRVLQVLVVDDHPVVREGACTMLRGEPGIEVVGEASSGEEAVQKTKDLEPDMILMDIRMPGMDGIEAVKRIKKISPTTSVIMLTVYDSEVYVVEAIRAGAAGYLTKDCSRELLFHAIRSVVDGSTMVRSSLLRQAMQGLRRVSQQHLEEEADFTPAERLTSREMDVLRLLVKGYANREIANKLSLAEVTAKKHIQNIIGKLGVSDRTHAAVTAVRLGLVE